MNPTRLVTRTIQRSLNHLGYEIVRRNTVRVNYDWLAHFLYFKELYDLIPDVEGDVVECGVGYGHTFLKLCCLAHFENRGRRIYGFDSFEGFPEPSEEDRSPRNPQKGEWNVSNVKTIYELLTEACHVERAFVHDNVKLCKGFFGESLHKYDGKSVAFLHLDVDLYQSYKVTLEYFWPKMAQGGVVLFDEYHNALRNFPGASKAIDEFFGELAVQIQFNERANRYYIVKR